MLVEIGSVDVVLHFRFSTLYKLGRKWGLKTVNEILEKIVALSSQATQDISFDTLDMFVDIVTVCSDKELNREEVLDYLQVNPQTIVDLIVLLVDSVQSNVVDKSKSEKDTEDLGK